MCVRTQCNRKREPVRPPTSCSHLIRHVIRQLQVREARATFKCTRLERLKIINEIKWEIKKLIRDVFYYFISFMIFRRSRRVLQPTPSARGTLRKHIRKSRCLAPFWKKEAML